MAYTTSQAVEALNEYMGCDEALKQYIDGTKERGFVLSLNTGEKIPCDLVIACTGVRSNIGFLNDSGVDTDKFGLIINEKMVSEGKVLNDREILRMIKVLN